jgi:hypothetical protein
VTFKASLGFGVHLLGLGGLLDEESASLPLASTPDSDTPTQVAAAVKAVIEDWYLDGTFNAPHPV